MNLVQYETKIKKMSMLIKDFQSDKYSCSRDENGNLKISFEDGTEISLPVIPLRTYQIELQKKLYIDKIRRHLLVRPRRAGKEVESWNMIIQGAIEEPGLYLMIYPTNVRAKGVLWDGAIVMPDGSSLKFLDMIPKRLISRINQQEMKIYFKSGAVIWVLGSDIDPDKLRGTNARGIVRSEAAFGDPRVMYILLPVLVQNGGWLINQSTFNGTNHFYKLYNTIKENKDWYVCVDSIESLVDENGIRYITDEMVDQDRQAGMPEYLIKQEYYSEVQLNEESMFFSREISHIYENGKIQSGLFLYGENVYTFWDLGAGDATSVIYVQFDDKRNPVIIGHIEEVNRNIDYFVDQARSFCARHGLTVHTNFMPHDGINRHQTSGGDSYVPKSCADIARELGQVVVLVKRPKAKIDGINLMRKMLYRTTFNEENTHRLIECLSNYGKEFDQKHGVYKDSPFPKWATNSVDSYQTMTLAIESQMVQNNTFDVIYYDR